jgi:two-component system sensor histidine kinase UhpB
MGGALEDPDRSEATRGARVARAAWLPLAILIAGGLATVFAGRALRAANEQLLVREIESQAAAVQLEIAARLDDRVRALSRMAAAWSEGGPPSEARWRADARQHYDPVDGYQAIQWVDPEMRVVWVEPQQSNEEAIGRDLGGEPVRRAAMDLARKQRAPAMTAPVALAQGGTGVLVFIPLFEDERFHGFLVAVFDPRRLVDSILGTDIATDLAGDFGIAVFAGGSPVFERGPALLPEDRAWSREARVDESGPRWRVQVWLPAAARAARDSRSPEWVMLGGASLTILLAIATTAAQRASHRKRALERVHRRELAALEERARAEASLAASELRFRQVVENVGAVFWRWSLDPPTLEYVSPGYETIWGRSCASLYADPLSWVESVHPEDRDRAALDLSSAHSTRSYDDRHYRIVRGDGSIRWIRDRAFLVRDADGTVRGVAGLAEDVTELQARQEALRQAREELEVVARAQPDLFVRLAQDGTVLEYRPGHEVALYRRAEEFLGLRLCDVLPADAAASVATGLARIAAGSALETIEYALAMPDRVRRFEARMVALPDQQVLALVRDCTQRHDAETLLRGETAIFGMVARHAPLAETLTECCRLVERLCPGARAAILLNDAAEHVLRRCAAPSLSEAFVAALDRFPIAPDAGPCGAAAHAKRPIIVTDVASDPGCAPYRELAVREDVRAIWSYPMIDQSGKVLGALAAHQRTSRAPSAEEIAVLERIRDLATIAAELIQAEQALRLTQFAVDHVADLIFQIDSDGRIVEANPSACRRLGYTRAELLTMNLGDIDADFPMEAWPATWAEVRRLRQWRLESRHRTTNYVEHEGRSFSYAIVRDITDWKASLAALEESEERLRLATEAGGMATWDWDARVDTLRYSPNLLRLFGFPADATPAPSRFFEAVHPEDRARVGSAISAALRGVPMEDLEVRVTWPDGTVHWVATHSRIHADASGQAVRMIGIMTDVDQRKAADREREVLLAEVRAANAMLTRLSRQLLEVQETERRDLSRDLHDEIGQCITAAKLNIDRLCRRFPELATEAPIADTVAVLDHILQHVGRLCLQLRPSVLDDLGLGAALRWYVNRQAVRGGWDAEFESDELPTLDETTQSVCFRTVQEALTNVMRHARAQRVFVALRRHADGLLLRISDDGVGFDPIARTTRTWSSGGLGLLGMRERLLSVGGALRIESAPGRGTTLEARLPLPASQSLEPLAPSESVA